VEKGITITYPVFILPQRERIISYTYKQATLPTYYPLNLKSLHGKPVDGTMFTDMMIQINKTKQKISPVPDCHLKLICSAVSADRKFNRLPFLRCS
jgi:hypothetical protein